MKRCRQQAVDRRRYALEDGRTQAYRIAMQLYEEVFEPLKDRTLCGQVSVHPEFHTLSWPNGADFAPEFLYENVQVST